MSTLPSTALDSAVPPAAIEPPQVLAGYQPGLSRSATMTETFAKPSEIGVSV